MAAASSAPVMLTKVSIASCGGRAMAGGAPAPAAWGAGPWRCNGEEVGEESRSSGAVRGNSSGGDDIMLSYCCSSSLPSRGPCGPSAVGRARTTDAGNDTGALTNACVSPRWRTGAERSRGMGVKRHRQRLFSIFLRNKDGCRARRGTRKRKALVLVHEGIERGRF